MSSEHKLPPINLEEDIKKYEARSESREVKFDGCKHKETRFEKGELKCKCGASWSGPRLNELQNLLSK